ncbi:MAG: phosphoribosylformylglycinamidine cyclo-ligase [Spirochaetes bacterium]|nr:phosphoribosylformylglycinamidine cyclo-ligase [Spirochaetota bacterium]
MGLTYRDSGVDVSKGNEFVKKITPAVSATFSPRVLTGIGGFGALFLASFPEMEEPVLVAGTDGVGTKLKIAQMMGIHNTVGIDAVAMCVNDILTAGAQPLFFLDYLACGKLNEKVHVEVVRGIAEGCRIAGCSLIGGETAEHPGIMAEGDYDIAGFAVGIVDRKKIITGDNINPGDVIIGLSSSGIHSNGYSLVRKLFFEIKKYSVHQHIDELGCELGIELLKPTRIYCKSVLHCLENRIKLKGLVHITGGGFYENIPRILPTNCAALVEKSSFEIPAIFRIIQKEGNVDEREMYTTFNMGIGMMAFVEKTEASNALQTLRDAGEKAVIIGEVVEYCNEKVIIE